MNEQIHFMSNLAIAGGLLLVVAHGSGRYALDKSYGPLPALLLILTGVTGLVDAVSYLKLGHVFLANMTGTSCSSDLPLPTQTTFRFPPRVSDRRVPGRRPGGRPDRLKRGPSSRPALWRLPLTADRPVGAALVVSMVGAFVQYSLIALLALAMGLQNATARRLGVRT